MYISTYICMLLVNKESGNTYICNSDNNLSVFDTVTGKSKVHRESKLFINNVCTYVHMYQHMP